MKQTINLLLSNPRIEILRKKYDPNYKKIKTHITLVYPFEVSDQEKLYAHIENCIKDFPPFEIVLEKLRKSGNYLVLDVGKNQKTLMALYKKLNSGILAGFENKDISIYIPHITLGIFKTHEELMEAINDLRKRGSNFRFNLDRINLSTLNPDNSINETKIFKLK